MHTRLMRLKEVMTRTGLSRSTIYGLIKDKKFPNQVVISARCVGWVEDEIHDFILKRLEASRGSVAS